MKIAMTILLSFICLNSYGYENLKGCFETVSFNGQEVQNGPSMERSESELYITENKYFRELESNRKLDTLVMSVFNGFRDLYYFYSNVVIPVDKGEWTRDGNESFFKMDEDIIFYNSNYERVKIDLFVDAKFKSEGDFLEATIYYASVKREMFYDFTVKLKRKDCL